MKQALKGFLGIVACFFAACGGGSSGDDGTVFQGTLTQRGSSHQSTSEVNFRHSDGQTIGEVRICIQEVCSVTDDLGQWGVNVEGFQGGDVQLSIDGHGISTVTTTNVPQSARDVIIDLDHSENVVTVSRLMIDGVDHTDHNHDH